MRFTLNFDRLTILFLSLFVVLAGCAEQAEEMADSSETEEMADEAPAKKASWGYEGDMGPAAWGSLSEEFATCSAGVEQSPINIVAADAQMEAIPALNFTYGEATLDVADSGHGFTATPSGEHMLTVGDDTFKLLQFHAHTPSEHVINGESYPMDVHFVHINDAGELAVVGVMISSGEASASYEAYTSLSSGGEADAVDLMSLLPSDHSYFAYSGSLTTPPCSEGVRWHVLKEAVTLSPEQIEVIASAHGNTNRPVMPLGDRMVKASQ